MIEIPQPDDWHVHLRDNEMLAAVVRYTARRFRYAMVMPNLMPPIVSTSAAQAYLDRILAHVPADAPDFRPMITLYCSAEVDLVDLRSGIESGLVGAVKYYPAGATTNSAAGGASMADFMALYEVLIETDTRLLVHAESTDPSIDIFDREAAFLDDQLGPLCASLPELKVTVEHISTAAGVEFVNSHQNLAGSVTPHHLARTRSDLLASGMKPDLYCKPVINSSDDRDALVREVTSGNPRLFLGTDSAPHPTTAKYGPSAKAGVFNAAYGLEVVAEVFAEQDALELLGAFVSVNGCAIYGVEEPQTRLRLEREDVDMDRATELTTEQGDQVVLFGADEASRWSVTTLP